MSGGVGGIRADSRNHAAIAKSEVGSRIEVRLVGYHGGLLIELFRRSQGLLGGSASFVRSTADGADPAGDLVGALRGFLDVKAGPPEGDVSQQATGPICT